ncbi:unnamed protein product, partial [Vitis vinifera]|uniref:Uncharacterized protein n=1 Tax=Vitis vinifera TaxID=29760 RepID=D7TW28_VITVI
MRDLLDAKHILLEWRLPSSATYCSYSSSLVSLLLSLGLCSFVWSPTGV